MEKSTIQKGAAGQTGASAKSSASTQKAVATITSAQPAAKIESDQPKEALTLHETFVQTQVQVGGLQIISASDELFNHVDAGLPMWAGDGDREVRLDVAFANAFAEPPGITLGLTGIDAAHDQNLRFWLDAVDVTAKGFTIMFKTWDDTHIARASVAWQALGKYKT